MKSGTGKMEGCISNESPTWFIVKRNGLGQKSLTFHVLRRYPFS
jgi:hypothetical protein